MVCESRATVFLFHSSIYSVSAYWLPAKGCQQCSRFWEYKTSKGLNDHAHIIHKSFANRIKKYVQCYDGKKCHNECLNWGGGGILWLGYSEKVSLRNYLLGWNLNRNKRSSCALDYYSRSFIFHLQVFKFISQAPDPFIQMKSLNLPVRTVSFSPCSFSIIILHT